MTTSFHFLVICRW